MRISIFEANMPLARVKTPYYGLESGGSGPGIYALSIYIYIYIPKTIANEKKANSDDWSMP